VGMERRIFEERGEEKGVMIMKYDCEMNVMD
jgi:hypothetical protein